MCNLNKFLIRFDVAYKIVKRKEVRFVRLKVAEKSNLIIHKSVSFQHNNLSELLTLVRENIK